MNEHRNRTGELTALGRHLGRIRRIACLTYAEERALALRARAGDAAARQQLVRHHLPLAVAVARRQSRGAVPLEDLVQEGSLGLVRAAESYDPGVGTRFSAYAVWWIRAYIGKYLKQARSSVRPRSGTVASDDVSLDVSLGDDGASQLDRIDDEEPTPEEACGRTEGNREVRVAVGRVRGRVGKLGWYIIQNRLAHDTPQTLEQIGRRWGVSRERVRQVELATREILHRSLLPIHEREAA